MTFLIKSKYRRLNLIWFVMMVHCYFIIQPLISSFLFLTDKGTFRTHAKIIYQEWCRPYMWSILCKMYILYMTTAHCKSNMWSSGIVAYSSTLRLGFQPLLCQFQGKSTLLFFNRWKSSVRYCRGFEKSIFTFYNS